MKKLIYYFVIVLVACHDRSDKNPSLKTNIDADIIQYLKNTYRVHPDTVKMDSSYKNYLLSNHQSLTEDDLIKSHLKVVEYKPMHLLFINFENNFGVHDTAHKSRFSINLIQNMTTKRFYTDYINVDSDIFTEAYCMWSYNKQLSVKTNPPGLTKKNVEAYNKIPSRSFGEQETSMLPRKNGIESFLNDTYKFVSPAKKDIDSLLLFYDKNLHYRNDTLLKSATDLLTYFGREATRIKNKPDYGTLISEVAFLKDQIDLLLLQTPHDSARLYFLWIYKNGSGLRTRRMLISGNEKASYAYRIDETSICFQ